MNHQDWNQVIIGKSVDSQKPRGPHGNRTQAQADIARLENDEPVKRNMQKIKEFATMIKNARLAKSMNQKQFATAMNIKVDLVQGIESGKTIPDAALMQKMKQKLTSLIHHD